jgi:hypothetical protein
MGTDRAEEQRPPGAAGSGGDGPGDPEVGYR